MNSTTRYTFQVQRLDEEHRGVVQGQDARRSG